MPVSPQDFALWSNLTGNPYPQTPAERMALAPEVYQFNKNLARQGGTGMSPLRRAVDVIGKTALAAGALAGAAYLGDKYIRSQESETQDTKVDSAIAGLLPAGKPSSTETAPTPLESPSAPRASTSQIVEALGYSRAKGPAGIAASRLNPPSMTEAEREEAYTTAEDYRPYSTGQSFPSVSARAEALIGSLGRAGAGYQKLEVDNEPNLAPSVVVEPHHAVSRTVAASADITPPTTSDRYLQDVIPNQTALVQQARGTSPVKPTVVASEIKPATQSDVIASKQQFSPGSEIEQIGDVSVERQRAEAFRKSAAYSVMQKQYDSLAPIQSSTEPASAAPETLTNVQPSPQVKVSRPAVVVESESPIAVMAKPATSFIASTPPQIAGGPSPEEIRDTDNLLAKAMAGHTPEQRMQVRNQMLSKKYGSGESIVTPSQPATIRVAKAEPSTSGPSPESVQFAREAARGMSRIGLMAQKEERRAPEESVSESRELADPRLMRAMMARPTVITRY